MPRAYRLEVFLQQSHNCQPISTMAASRQALAYLRASKRAGQMGSVGVQMLGAAD
jgi:hypothetical protein